MISAGVYLTKLLDEDEGNLGISFDEFHQMRDIFSDDSYNLHISKDRVPDVEIASQYICPDMDRNVTFSNACELYLQSATIGREWARTLSAKNDLFTRISQLIGFQSIVKEIDSLLDVYAQMTLYLDECWNQLQMNYITTTDNKSSFTKGISELFNLDRNLHGSFTHSYGHTVYDVAPEIASLKTSLDDIFSTGNLTSVMAKYAENFEQSKTVLIQTLAQHARSVGFMPYKIWQSTALGPGIPFCIGNSKS